MLFPWWKPSAQVAWLLFLEPPTGQNGHHMWHPSWTSPEWCHMKRGSRLVRVGAVCLNLTWQEGDGRGGKEQGLILCTGLPCAIHLACGIRLLCSQPCHTSPLLQAGLRLLHLHPPLPHSIEKHRKHLLECSLFNTSLLRKKSQCQRQLQGDPSRIW